MSTAWSSFHSAMRRFQHAREGNIAITFAIAVIPLLGFVGAAIDYSRANTVKVQLQSALDSTALMLARDAPNLSDVSSNNQSSPLDSKAQAIFTSLFNPSDATNININATFSTTGGSSVKLDASADVPTTFLAIVGYNTIKVGGSTTSKWGSARLRVALVLDNTGSMARAGKMTALKTATTNLLSQLQSAASTDGDVYVSIIPFTKDVNVGSGTYYSRLDRLGRLGDEQRQLAVDLDLLGQLVASRPQPLQQQQDWVPNDHITWNGCVTDRDKDYDQPATAPNHDQNVDAAGRHTASPCSRPSNTAIARWR